MPGLNRPAPAGGDIGALLVELPVHAALDIEVIAPAPSGLVLKELEPVPVIDGEAIGVVTEVMEHAPEAPKRTPVGSAVEVLGLTLSGELIAPGVIPTGEVTPMPGPNPLPAAVCA
jgi:hypothetical protein